MANSRVEKVGALLREEAVDFLSYSQIESLTTERGYSTSVRTIRFYVKEGILPSPRKEGNTPVFPKGEILSLLFSIHLMKSRFSRTLNQIQRVLAHFRTDAELLSEKLALLYEETQREGRHRLEREWLIETFFETIDGRCVWYPIGRRGEPGPRTADDILVTELLDDLERLACWKQNKGGNSVWQSPTEVLEQSLNSRDAKVGHIMLSGESQPANGNRVPAELSSEAIELDEARRLEELFLQRFENKLSKLPRIFSPVEKKSYSIKPGTLDPQVIDPYQKVVDLLKEKGVYDRGLLERLPHDRSTRFTLPPAGLFGKKSPKLVISGVVASPIDQFVTLGASDQRLGESDLARVLREQVVSKDAYHVLGVLSTVGWDDAVFRSPPRGDRLAVVVVQASPAKGWESSHTLPKELLPLLEVFDPEMLVEKVRRAFYRIIEHPKLKIPGGHVEVEEFLSEVDLSREIFDQAMKQVTHEDSRLKIVQVSGSELLKRDRF